MYTWACFSFLPLANALATCTPSSSLQTTIWKNLERALPQETVSWQIILFFFNLTGDRTAGVGPPQRGSHPPAPKEPPVSFPSTRARQTRREATTRPSARVFSRKKINKIIKTLLEATPLSAPSHGAGRPLTATFPPPFPHRSPPAAAGALPGRGGERGAHARSRPLLGGGHPASPEGWGGDTKWRPQTLPKFPSVSVLIAPIGNHTCLWKCSPSEQEKKLIKFWLKLPLSVIWICNFDFGHLSGAVTLRCGVLLKLSRLSLHGENRQAEMQRDA